MEQGVLSIRWDTGHMDILLDPFFPCSMDKFKKLLKVIDLDWEHADTLKETLKVYFQEQISAKKNTWKRLTTRMNRPIKPQSEPFSGLKGCFR